MTPEILQLCSFSPLLEQLLRSRFRVHRWFETADRERLLREQSAAIRAVVTGGHIGVSDEMLAQLPALGLIAINGVGFDKVNLEESRRRGIRVTTTPGVLTDDVADLALGLIVSLLRGIPASDQFVRDGQWLNGERPLARKVSGKRFGIIGMGNIGRAIGHRLAALGPVSYFDRSQKQVPYMFVPTPVELARQCDVLVLAASANTSTHRLVGREILDALGEAGYLVNVARGALINEEELIAALVEKRIAGAALDVFADEPNVPGALRTAANAVMTPHIASATVETREAMARAVIANLDAFYAGQPLPGGIA